MDLIKQYKGAIVTVIVVVVVFYVYSAYFDKSVPAITEDGKEEVGRDLLVLLGELKELKFDGEIFEDVLFISLIDYQKDIPEQPKGRENPFAPIGQ